MKLLIVYPRVKVMRLYDLTIDPPELTDLAENRDYDEIKARLFNQLLQLQKEMDDPLDLQKLLFLK